ncbi:Gfo/Idh/MocA family oxidoreductase [candidate division KSB1 bacterium]|nr:Gfo/Idh/MocA family oxidoreductase [candidate division KSB1 bacterium]
MALKTAILGYGRSGSTMHAGAIEKNPAFELAAVSDIDPLRQQQARERFGCRIYPDYLVMLQKEALDLVIIVTRSDQHCAMTCDCLEAGVNVLVTKPWAVNVAEAEQMIATCQKTGQLLLPWLPARWSCDLRRLQELIRENVIGNIFFVRRTVSSFGTRHDWQTERRFGGGYLLNWGPHIIDPPRLLFNQKIHRVYAQMRQTINPGDAEDVFFAVLTLADQRLIQVEFTIAVSPLPDWYLQGDRGTIIIRGAELEIYQQTPPHPADPTDYAAMKTTPPVITKETLTGALYGDEHEIYHEIGRALRHECRFPVTLDSALELSQLMAAIRAASSLQQVVVLNAD